MTFASPGQYIQGRNALRSLVLVLEQLDSHKHLLLQDTSIAEIVGTSVGALEGTVRTDFGGECSSAEIERVSAIAEEEKVDAIVAIGGGKTLDTAKSVAHPLKLPLIVVPTLASTDAPTSALAVVYNEQGVFQEFRFFDRNPDVVIVDTTIVAGAPTRFFVAGMGDGLSTYFEAESSSRTRHRTMSGGVPTRAALTLAQLCYDTLLEHGPLAKLAVDQGAVTPAVEQVVEANTLLSGLGFESGGLAAAHSIHNGLTVLPDAHHILHGEKVAFGTICMLVLEERPKETIEEVVDFCLEVGLPVTLESLGLKSASREDVEEVSAAACVGGETIHNEPFEIYPEIVTDAILTANAFGHHRWDEQVKRTQHPTPERSSSHRSDSLIGESKIT